MPTNQEFTNWPFRAAGASHAFTHKDSQNRKYRVRNPAVTQALFLKSYGQIGAQSEFKLKDDPVGVAAYGGGHQRVYARL